MALLDTLKRGLRLGRPRHEPTRETVPFPEIIRTGGYRQGNTNGRMAGKPTPRHLRQFGKTVYARRAINGIKNPIAMLDWELKPVRDTPMNAELERQIEVASYCLSHPNHDDSFRTWIEQIVEDVCHGAGASELQSGGDPARPLWMFPVDGLSIQLNPGWDGKPEETRYVQVPGYGSLIGMSGISVPLRNDELMYLRPNPSTATPFGLGPLEVAFQSISRIIGVGEFAGNVASNARPSIAIDLGDNVSAEYIASFRQYWRDEVEGQGSIPIFGLDNRPGEKVRGASIQRLFPEGDNGLYLKWQEFLKTEIALAFDMSPMNLGVERDVNRNTAEVGQDRDRDNCIKPFAKLVAEHITRDALHAKLGFYQLEFRFKGLDPEDEEMHATVFGLEYLNNAVTPNEYRARRGMPPLTNPFAEMLHADVEIAKEAARGAAQVDDPNLTGGKSPAAKPTPKPKAKPAPKKG